MSDYLRKRNLYRIKQRKLRMDKMRSELNEAVSKFNTIGKKASAAMKSFTKAVEKLREHSGI